MNINVEAFGRYEIRSGLLGDQWAARAFRRKVLVADATGKSREEAVNAVKAGLQRLSEKASNALDSDGAPPAAAYKQAFEAVLPSLPKNYVAMLQAHFNAPGHLISATDLAEAAGYSGYEGANLHYGKLGFQIAEEIGYLPPKRADGTEIWTFAIARDPANDDAPPERSMTAGSPEGSDAGHFKWLLRPQVVQALCELGWRPTTVDVQAG